MNNAGITAQYGFLFQRKAFVLFALENTGTKQTFTFEGKDDVEISTNECIYSVKTADSNYIQVKSGTVDESCFCKIICNWLLLDKIPSDTLILFAENQLEVPISNVTKDAILEYILKGKEKKKSSIARKTYNKFQDIIETDRDAFLEIIDRHLQAIKLQVCSMDNLDRRLESAFFDNYCQDITEYELAKSKRLDRFISYINQEIDTALKSKEPCTLLYPDLIKIIMKTCDEINDQRYVAKIPELKKRVKGEATRLVEDNVIREVRQLYLVDKHDEFVIDGIVHEMLYKDFRDVYIAQREVEIINLEQNAYENFTTAKFSLDEPESFIPKKVYQRTIETPIGDSLLPDGPVYRKGCYIFLTGEDIDKDSQITWGDYDE
ncbi:hypothetical protein [Dysosmobacter welbionis]